MEWLWSLTKCSRTHFDRCLPEEILGDCFIIACNLFFSLLVSWFKFKNNIRIRVSFLDIYCNIFNRRFIELWRTLACKHLAKHLFGRKRKPGICWTCMTIAVMCNAQISMHCSKCLDGNGAGERIVSDEWTQCAWEMYEQWTRDSDNSRSIIESTMSCSKRQPWVPYKAS